MKFFLLPEIVEKLKAKLGRDCRRLLFSLHVEEIWITDSGNIFLWNLESWALVSGIQLKESGILLKIGIQNPNFTNKDRNPVPGIRNPGRRIQNPRLSLIPLHGVTTLPLACSPTLLPKKSDTFLDPLRMPVWRGGGIVTGKSLGTVVEISKGYHSY